MSKESILHCIEQRRSTRFYSADTLSLEELSYLLWATQGITGMNVLQIIHGTLINFIVTRLEGSAEHGEVRQGDCSNMDGTGFERRDHFIYGKRNRAGWLVVFLFIADGHSYAQLLTLQLVSA